MGRDVTLKYRGGILSISSSSAAQVSIPAVCLLAVVLQGTFAPFNLIP